MAWNRSEPDPLEARRRQLAELEKNLAEQRRRLLEQMQPFSPTTSEPVARAEPLVWRNEDDAPLPRAPSRSSGTTRTTARQTRRDMLVAVSLIILLLIILGLGLWIAHVHNIAPGA